MPTTLASIRVALLLAAIAAPAHAVAEAAPRISDVPPSQSAPPPIAWQANGFAQQQQRDDAERADSFYAVGAGVLVAGYISTAGTALMGETTNWFGCAVSDVGSAITSSKSGPCPSTGTGVLYIPLAGPVLFLAKSDRIHDVAFDGLVIVDGAVQLLGVGLLVGGVVTSVSGGSEEPVSPGLKVGALKLIPSAPGALAGARLRLDF